jgi:hypothetical protein
VADDRERRLILARRARFVTAALASAGLVVSAPSCGGETDDKSQHKDGSASGGTGGTPQPCLSAPYGGTGGTPQPCLEPPYSGGTGGTSDEDAALDAAPDPDASDADSGD